MKIYTKAGDTGTTQVKKDRLAKNDQRVRALGSIDEAQAHLGMLYEMLKEGNPNEPYNELRMAIDALYTLGAVVGSQKEFKELISSYTNDLERAVDKFMDGKHINEFLRPVGSKLIAQSHITRTVVRRAEREMIGIVDASSLKFMNRLSDYIFSIIVDLVL